MQYKVVVSFLHHSVISSIIKAVPHDYSVVLSQVSNSLFSCSFSQTGVSHVTVPSSFPCDFFSLRNPPRRLSRSIPK